MPDITMCTNRNCPIRRSCYRYVAIPTPKWQSYAAFAPYKDEAGLTCKHYLSANGHSDRLPPNQVDKQWEMKMKRKKKADLDKVYEDIDTKETATDTDKTKATEKVAKAVVSTATNLGRQFYKPHKQR